MEQTFAGESFPNEALSTVPVEAWRGMANARKVNGCPILRAYADRRTKAVSRSWRSIPVVRFL
jgi:hypothetical protein